MFHVKDPARSVILSGPASLESCDRRLSDILVFNDLDSLRYIAGKESDEIKTYRNIFQ